jgi:general secretion pathway protein J
MNASRAGFTLIELLISIALLAIISIGVYTTTASTFELREKLQAEAEFYNSVRSALAFIERDMIMMYTPQLAAMPGAMAQAEVAQPGVNPSTAAGDVFNPGIAQEYWGQLINRYVRPSRLQGDEGKISFVANSHVRIYRNSKESDLIKVSYAVEDDDLPIDAKQTKILVRYHDPDVFRETGRDSETKIRTVIFRGLKSVKFSYLDGRNDQWQNHWDTDYRDTKNRFPALIKIVVDVFQPPPLPTDQTFSVSQVYKPELAL